jgi:hypothetical protein
VTSPVDITNRALQAIGTRSSIAALNEGSNEANNASLSYVPTRQQLIRAAPWRFATTTAQLSLLKAAPGTLESPLPATTWSNAYPAPGWSYQYAYPQDCERARKVVPGYLVTQGSATPIFPVPMLQVAPWSMPGVRFEVATDLDANNNPYTCILSNLDQALLVYLRDIAVESLWDAAFVDAMVLGLAGSLALALTGDKQLANLMFNRANAAITSARAADANEGLTVIDHDADWITHGHGLRRLGGPTLGDYVLPFGPMFSLLA